MPNAAQMKWPTQAKVREFFGEPGNPKCTAGMADVYPMRIAWSKSDIVRRFRCHSLVEQSMEMIFKNALAHYGQAQLTKLGLDLFGGCYNLRQMRGGTNWSMHSWGIAVDLDTERTQLTWGSDSWKIRRRLVFLTELYCAIAVGYMIIFGPDDELRRAAVNGLILLAGATLQGYVFGVIFDKTQVQPAGSVTEIKQTVTTTPPEPAPKVEIKEPEPPKGFAEN